MWVCVSQLFLHCLLYPYLDRQTLIFNVGIEHYSALEHAISYFGITYIQGS